jgi:hypothetical protein
MQSGASRHRAVLWCSGERTTTAGQRANVRAHCRRQLRLVSRADTANLSAGDTLVPVFSPGTTRRDVALAYYKGLLEGTFTLQQKAYEEWEAIKPELTGDKDALAALGILSEERGDYKLARKLFSRSSYTRSPQSDRKSTTTTRTHKIRK